MRQDVYVPYGLDPSGRLVPPTEAAREVAYCCPGCASPLILRAGAVKRPHFAHDTQAACQPESLLHRTAKQLIAQVVSAWKAGAGPAPVVMRSCVRCRHRVPQQLPAYIDGALVEHVVDDRWRADVALVRGQEVIGIVEILVTHQVGREKAEALTVPCAELAGAAVVQNPLVWVPLATTARKWTCPSCTERAARALEEEKRAAQEREVRIQETARRLNQPVPGPPYTTGITTCWKCRHATLVYTWKGHVEWCQHAPPEPRPRTLSFEYSKVVRHKYWANTCGNCGRLQGDYFLYNEPDGPFFGMSQQGEQE